MSFFSTSFISFPEEHFPDAGLPAAHLVSSPRNRFGYRGREFDDLGKRNILFIGDEWTEGLGVDYAATYPAIVARRLTAALGVDVHEFNLGHHGKSYDYIGRVLWCALNTLTPDFVFICFPPSDRREYIALDGRLIDYSPAYSSGAAPEGRKMGRIERELCASLGKVLTPFDEPITALKNYLLIEALLDERAIDWAFAFNGSDAALRHARLLTEAGWMKRERALATSFERLDEDPSHRCPGPRSHAAFGEAVSTRIREAWANRGRN